MVVYLHSFGVVTFASDSSLSTDKENNTKALLLFYFIFAFHKGDIMNRYGVCVALVGYENT